MAAVLAFLGVCVVVICTPGPDTALTIRNSLLGGRRGGIFTASGVSAGQATWALATSAGVAALLRASEPAFLAVKYAGAVYLAYLGAHSLLGAIRRRPPAPRPAPRRLSPRSAFRQGVVSNLSNPKMAAFFPSLLPQFASSFGALLALGLCLSLLTLSWLTAYAVVVAKAGDFLRRGWLWRALDAATGIVLIALGFRVAAERR